ncbi:unnamed protein product [Sphenostylis stenocarpa]|uniref:Uncharacterized protein n=1 Tax=Sphenostylis stenocarpa TaxID=92480 RepID=A0AA86SL07_9FABA|nr:unnamed protein product [Sphenostylis stenocarpa]
MEGDAKGMQRWMRRRRGGDAEVETEETQRRLSPSPAKANQTIHLSFHSHDLDQQLQMNTRLHNHSLFCRNGLKKLLNWSCQKRSRNPIPKATVPITITSWATSSVWGGKGEEVLEGEREVERYEKFHNSNIEREKIRISLNTRRPKVILLIVK